MPPERVLRSEVIQTHYDDITAGYFGVTKTLELVRRKYFWIRLKRDIKEYITSYTKC